MYLLLQHKGFEKDQCALSECMDELSTGVTINTHTRGTHYSKLTGLFLC